MIRSLSGTLRRLAAPFLAGGLVAVGLGALVVNGLHEHGSAAPIQTSDALALDTKPALTVATVTPRFESWAVTVSANGNIAAWDEAAIAAEVGGLAIVEVKVNVGDRVRQGQTVIVLATTTLEADVAAMRAGLAETEAVLAEAHANADRARQIGPSGALSQQQIHQYLTAEQSAMARVQAQRARLQAGEQRLKQTRIVAPDDGIISSRTATIGAVVQSGQDLLRLIRGGRLEWRAEVTAADLGKIVPGQKATVRTVVGSTLGGTVRLVAPTIDPTTRNGIVYVDLPAEAPVRAGMFARGSVHVGESQAITLPQSAITLRDGYSYAYIVANDNRVKANKLHLGDWLGDRVDVLEGIAPGDRVVASGVGFLNDGDLVRIAYADAPAMAGTAKAQGSSADRQ